MPSQGAAAAPHGHGERRRSSGRPAPRLSGAGSPSPHGRFRSSRPAAGAAQRGGAGPGARRRRAGPPNRARTPIGGAAARGGPTEGDAQGRGAAVRVSARPMLAPGLERALGIRALGASPSGCSRRKPRHEHPPEPTASHRGHPESRANHGCSSRPLARRYSWPRSASLLKERGPHDQGGEGLGPAEMFGERGRARKCFEFSQVSAILLAGRKILDRACILFGISPKLRGGGGHRRSN